MARERLCRAGEIPPGGSRIFPVGPFGIGVFNLDGELLALDNHCPHAGAPVCRGRITGRTVVGRDRFELIWKDEGRILRCPWHHWEFDIATGKTLTDPTRHARKRPVHVQDGWVYVEL
jgi:nitrite reductase/ring-hydroxylating ferredoxin subunit